LTLVIVSRGLLRIDARRADAHANLGHVFFLPGFLLLVRVLLDFDLVYWWLAIAAGGVVGVALIAAAAAADRNMRRHLWTLLGCALLASIYGFGAVAEANVLLDRSRPSLFRSSVIDKHASYGKATRYLVRLAPWGPRDEPDDVSVSHPLYDRLQPGDPVCVLLRQGALGMPWFIILGCG
jgi:hypothetical protein